MNEKQQKDVERGFWLDGDQAAVHQLNSEFVAAVVTRVGKRVIYKELLFLIVLGFWGILLGFLKINPSQSMHQTQPERQKQ